MEEEDVMAKDTSSSAVSMPRRRRGEWWRVLPDTDPITLEPLCELKYPPFALETSDVPAYFDGQTLAHYIVSTGTFLNPMTRHPLSRQDCLRLDAYLADHRLKPARVADALAIQRQLGSSAGKSESLRREATAVFHSIFDFERYKDRKHAAIRKRYEDRKMAGNNEKMAGNLGRLQNSNPRAGLTVVDDDLDLDWDANGPLGTHALDHFLVQFPKLPELPSNPTPVQAGRGRGRGRGRGGFEKRRETGTGEIGAKDGIRPGIWGPKHGSTYGGAKETVMAGNGSHLSGDDCMDESYEGGKVHNGALNKVKEESTLFQAETDVNGQGNQGVVASDKSSPICPNAFAQDSVQENDQAGSPSQPKDEMASTDAAYYQQVLRRRHQEQQKLASIRKKDAKSWNSSEHKAKAKPKRRRKKNSSAAEIPQESFDKYRVASEYKDAVQWELRRRKRRGYILGSGLLTALVILASICISLPFPTLPRVLLFFVCFGVTLKVLLIAARWLDSARPLRSIRHPEAGPCHVVGQPIHVHLLALGTRGDVEPMFALAKALLAHGDSFTVTVVAAGCFRSDAEELGLGFQQCGVEQFAAESSWGEAESLGAFLRAISETYLEQYGEMSKQCWAACKSSHMIIAGLFGVHLALDFAEALDVPCWTVKFAPDTPTEFQPPFGDRPVVEQRSNYHPGAVLRRKWHSWLYVKRGLVAVDSAKKAKLTIAQNAFRVSGLGLPELTAERLEEAVAMMPTLYAYSPHVICKPKDWPVWHHVVGYFWLDQKETLPLPETLKSFEKLYSRSLDERPVCVTLGSMTDAKSSESLERIIVQVVTSMGKTCILLTRKERHDSLQNAADKAGKLVLLESFPHDQLFPLCSFVVHHGGSGTTARALRAGVASVVVPVLKWYDQAGWGFQVEQLNAGKCVIPEPCKNMDQGEERFCGSHSRSNTGCNR